MKSFKISILIILISLMITSCVSVRVATTETQIQEIIQKANDNFYLDERIWYQDVRGELKDGKIILTGEAFFEIPVRAIGRRLKKAGYEQEIIDNVSYLPQAFPEEKGYAVVTVPYVMSRYKPVDEKQEGTELLFGEPVRLIRDADPYYQVQSTTGYLGYIRKNAVRTMKLDEWSAYHAPQQAVFGTNLALEGGLSIKMGTRLPYLGDEQLLLPDGSTLALSAEHYRISDAAANPIRQQILESGKEYLELPYVWGGRSSEGVDCSGFVMQTYSLNDLYLPRDTDEMSNIGRIIGLHGWRDAMLPGDLLFFTGNRRLITHVGIYMGDGKVIHSLGSGVQIQSIDPDDEDYAERLHGRFIFAKRVFD